MGQHFLRDRRVAEAMAAALPPGTSRVLEIGPGTGALTGPLLERFPRVRALELDRALAASLPGRLGRPAGLEVVVTDAVNADLDVVCEGEEWTVAGNLPYSVGTPILRRLLLRGDLFPVLLVMVQREVAQRLTALPGTPDRGLLSLEVEAHGEAQLLFSVPPEAFSPPPRVVSAVVLLRTRPPADVDPRAGAALELAASAFTHRRKKLANALAGRHPRAAAVLERLEWGGGLRPQDLSWDQWLTLAGALGCDQRGRA